MAYLGLSILDGQPRTVQLEIDDWWNTSWGFHAIDRRRISCEVAIASDGSRMNRCDYEALSHYLIPNGRHRYHTIYLRPLHRAYEIDDANHLANGGDCDCTWKTETLKQTDPECTGAAQAVLITPKRLGTEQMAGHRVVRYREDDDDGNSLEVAMAPSAGCEVFEEVRTSRGTFGIPGARRRYRVTSYAAGEPDARLFRIPEGYSVGHKGKR